MKGDAAIIAAQAEEDQSQTNIRSPRMLFACTKKPKREGNMDWYEKLDAVKGALHCGMSTSKPAWST